MNKIKRRKLSLCKSAAANTQNMAAAKIPRRNIPTMRLQNKNFYNCKSVNVVEDGLFRSEFFNFVYDFVCVFDLN